MNELGDASKVKSRVALSAEQYERERDVWEGQWWRNCCAGVIWAPLILGCYGFYKCGKDYRNLRREATALREKYGVEVRRVECPWSHVHCCCSESGKVHPYEVSES